MSSTEFPESSRSRVRRHPERASREREVVHAILDEGLIAHVGFVADGRPVVIPMACARDGERLLLHGSPASRLMRTLGDGVDACVTVTLIDGLVLARSAYHSSMNYRSVVVFGRARPIRDAGRKRAALERLTEHLLPGRVREIRPMTEAEQNGTEVLEFEIEEATAKVRSGPPSEPDADIAHPVWAGVLPLQLAVGGPEPAPNLARGIEPSRVVTAYARPRSGRSTS
jgi:uncharacterized protein